MKKLLIILLVIFTSVVSYSQRHPYYGGGLHTSTHGGHYSGGRGRSHRGGHYMNWRTRNTYGRHKRR